MQIAAVGRQTIKPTLSDKSLRLASWRWKADSGGAMPDAVTGTGAVTEYEVGLLKSMRRLCVNHFAPPRATGMEFY
jgi:hypothetical protein